MTYQLQDRLRHCSERMAENNNEKAIYVGERNNTTYTYSIEVSPILLSADELSPGNQSLTRVEYQDFAIDRIWLKNLYPPEIGDEVKLLKTNEKFRAASMGIDEPPYQHITSTRERVLVHTVRIAKGFNAR